jgi:hypothetical protein
MRKVFKYELSFSEPVSIPRFSQVVHAGIRGDKPFLWAEIDDENTIVNSSVKYAIFATGQKLPDIATHVKTFFDDDYVWHLYRVSSQG